MVCFGKVAWRKSRKEFAALPLFPEFQVALTIRVDGSLGARPYLSRYLFTYTFRSLLPVKAKVCLESLPQIKVMIQPP